MDCFIAIRVEGVMRRSCEGEDVVSGWHGTSQQQTRDEHQICRNMNLL